MTRPTQIAGLSSADFVAYYWLKADLAAFCRTNKLPTTGSKQELTERIQNYLATGEISRPLRQKKSRACGPMPSSFTPQSVIEPNWRCSQELRAFFESEIGPSFHFNQFLRNFIKNDGIGQTLQAAIDGWHHSKQVPRHGTEIAPQFEYNRHFRDYFAQNSGATRADCIRAWQEQKKTRRGTKQREAI